MAEKMVRVTVQITTADNTRLLALARSGGWPASWVVRQALREFLDRAEIQGKLLEAESEVTPAMIEAGIDALYGFNWGDCPEIDSEGIRVALKAAFIAMCRERS